MPNQCVIASTVVALSVAPLSPCSTGLNSSVCRPRQAPCGVAGSHASPSDSDLHPAADIPRKRPAGTWDFHWVICFGCTSTHSVSSARVASSLKEAKATFALNADEWSRRDLPVISAPASRHYNRLPDRTNPLIQLPGAISLYPVKNRTSRQADPCNGIDTINMHSVSIGRPTADPHASSMPLRFEPATHRQTPSAG